jgi:aminocarboxymuconate-semialdehyde decarboxylase
MYKIDCHSHFFDPYISEGISKILKENNIEEQNTYATRSKRDFLTPEERLNLMDRCGIDLAVIEYHIVYQHYEEMNYSESVRVKLSEFINDRLSEVTQKYPERYLWMADIPLMDTEASIEASIRELKRCYELGAKGLCLHTNVNGKPLISPEFRPFWVEVDRLGLPVFLHPRSDLKLQRISHYSYVSIIGYPFDTTLTALDFLMDNFFEKYKHIKVMLCHCGGALPFIKKRLDMSVAHFGGPSVSSMLNKFFYDTAISFPRQLEFTIAEVGLDQVCFGTDYPYFDFMDSVNAIEALGLADSQKEKIFSGNARRFFGIN